MSDTDRFPHLDEAGRARMVDVGDKQVTRRRALAEGSIRMERETLRAILDRDIAKGDVLAVARIAAVGGAKRTADLVPLCHPLPLNSVSVEIEAVEDLPGLRLTVEASTEARTGVEMEALCAVSAGLLAVYDMCKSMDRAMELGPVLLLEKEGGRSGMWRRGEPDLCRRTDVSQS
ncbi:MAG: cyclic pyranopterin monophosphate synthase MoaC [Gemmatimonadota bacterium]